MEVISVDLVDIGKGGVVHGGLPRDEAIERTARILVDGDSTAAKDCEEVHQHFGRGD